MDIMSISNMIQMHKIKSSLFSNFSKVNVRMKRIFGASFLFEVLVLMPRTIDAILRSYDITVTQSKLLVHTTTLTTTPFTVQAL